MRDVVGLYFGSDRGDVVVREQLDLRYIFKEEIGVFFIQVFVYILIVVGKVVVNVIRGEEVCICFFLNNFNSDQFG